MIRLTKPLDGKVLTFFSPEATAAYFEAAFENGDPKVIAHALGNVARAKGISQMAKETGV